MRSKNRSEPAKTQFRPRPVQRPKKTAVSVFFGPGPVFLVLGNVWTGLGLGLIFLGQKTGLDWTFEHYSFQTSQEIRQMNKLNRTMFRPSGT